MGSARCDQLLVQFPEQLLHRKGQETSSEKGYCISFSWLVYSVVPERILWFIWFCIVGGTVIIFTHGDILFLSRSSYPSSHCGSECHRLMMSYSSDVYACLWGILST